MTWFDWGRSIAAAREREREAAAGQAWVALAEAFEAGSLDPNTVAKAIDAHIRRVHSVMAGQDSTASPGRG